MFKTVLITGGAGAIGSNLAKALLDKAMKIIIIDDMDSGYEYLLPDNRKISLIKKSILNESALCEAFDASIDIVFHLAANFANQNSIDNPEKDLLVNGMGTLKLLEKAKMYKVNKFIFASSSCVYGNVEGEMYEDTTNFRLDTPYAITKLLGEKYVNFFHEYHKLNTSILRIFNSFGPGENPGKYRNVIPNFFKKAMSGEPLIITGDGQETRDFNWVENTTQGFLLAAEKKEAIGEIFNIGSGKETKIIDIAEHINNITGNISKIEFIDRRDWDAVINRKANISKAKNLLGYKPINDLEKHLKLTHEWLKLNKELNVY